MSFSLCFVTDRLSLTPAFQDREGNIIVQEVVRAAERLWARTQASPKDHSSALRTALRQFTQPPKSSRFSSMKWGSRHRVAVRVR